MIVSLISICILYGFASYATYNSEIRQSAWYTPIILLIGNISSVLWCVSTMNVADNKRIVWFSFAWDAAIIMAYGVIPFFIINRRMTWDVCCSLFLMVSGLIWLKYSLEAK